MSNENENQDQSNQEADANPEQDQLSTPDRSDALFAVMSDPDIQAVVAAKRAGESVTITSGEATPAEAESSEKQIDDHDELDDDVQRVLAHLDKKITPLFDDVASLKKLAVAFERSEADQQISQVSNKHKDFDKYRSEMADLARKHNGLGVEELFLLAKHRAGDLNVPISSTESERPTPTPRSRLNKDIRETGKRGRRAFASTLAKALDKIEYRRE